MVFHILCNVRKYKIWGRKEEKESDVSYWKLTLSSPSGLERGRSNIAIEAMTQDPEKFRRNKIY